MDKNEIIIKLKEKCSILLKKAKNESDEKKVKLYSTIFNILNNKNAFDKIDAKIALNILFDLGLSNQDALKIYNQLIVK